MSENKIINIKKRDKIRLLKCFAVCFIAALISALALHVFVYPSAFVPMGVEAISTMLYALYPNINAGYFNLILNAPLLIMSFFRLNKKYTFFSIVYMLLSSLFLIIFEKISFPQYAQGERLVSAIFAGIMLGVRSGLMLRSGASTGGVDIIAAMMQKKIPHVNVERMISVMCLVTIGVSYFVYHDFNSILYAVILMFIYEKATTFILRDTRKAVKVEIITKSPDLVREDIVVKLRHSATVLKGKGLYSGDDYYTVVTLLNLYQMAELLSILKTYKDTFVFYTEVQGVFGNFRWYRDDEVK